MLRRQIRTSGVFGACGLQVRAISNFEFGHPKLSQAFPCPKSSEAAAKDCGVQVTKLPNGARVVSHNKEGPQTSVGIYVEAGPKFDPASAPGLSYVMRWALPTSNFENSLFQIDRHLRAGGATQEHCEVRKSHVGWKIEARPDSWAKPFENLASCISVPRFPEYDIERFRDTMDNLREECRWQRPRDYVVDQLETVAYFKEPLGNPRMVPPNANDDCSASVLGAHWAKLFVPSNIVVAGVNVAHAELCSAYENAPFPHSSTSPHHVRAGEHTLKLKEEAVQYTGGEHHEVENRAKEMGSSPDMAAEIVFALGFPVKGKASPAEFATSLVIQQLVDIALEDGIRADRTQTLSGLRSFYRPYEASGLVGVSYFGSPAEGTASAIAAANVLKNLTINEDLVKVAASRAAVAFYHNELEYQRDYIDFLATSLQGKTDTFVSPTNVMESLGRVKVAAVKKLHQAAINSAPSFYATGETLSLPSLRQLGL